MPKKFALLILSMFLVLAACLSVPTGLVKTEFQNWHVQEFEDFGLSIELPEQHYFSTKGYLIKESSNSEYIENLGFKSIAVKMHLIYFGHIMTEPRYLLSVYITRLTESSYQSHIQGKSNLWLFGVFNKNQEIYHNKIVTYISEAQKCCPERKEQYLILRKDYQAVNGDYILCGAKIYSGSEEFIQPDEVDVKAVSRRLNSLKE